MYQILLNMLAAAAIAFWSLAAFAQTDRPFAPDRLTYLDARLLQAALAHRGTYVGRLDGAWGSFSNRALRSTVGERPTEQQVLLLLLPLLEELEDFGWSTLNPDGGTSALVPYALLATETGTDFVEMSTSDRDLVVRYIFRRADDSGAMHDWLRDAHVGPEEFYRADTSEAFISKGRIASGNAVYLRTIAADIGFETVLVQWGPGQRSRAQLIIASLANRPQGELVLPSDGYFSAILNKGAPQVAGRQTTEPPRQLEAPASARGSGTAFHISNADLLTAWHVVEGCERVTFEDGAPLSVIAHDQILDSALLTSQARSNHWVTFDPSAVPRLGQDVFALGFPYSRTEAEGVIATAGSLSGLASASERPRHMISAPVQPGNSGGPVIARSGIVVGLVTARLDDTATYDATGTIPQNVNFATPVAPILGFLKRNGVVLGAAPTGAPVLTDGIPDIVQQSVRRILCW